MRIGFFITLLINIAFLIQIKAQDSYGITSRTPEEIATHQTEKMRKELELNPEQIRKIYEINLQYAKMHQASNSRSEALQRLRNKNTEIQNILNPQQNEHLQSIQFQGRFTGTVIPNQGSKTMTEINTIRSRTRNIEKYNRISPNTERNSGSTAHRSIRQPQPTTTRTGTGNPSSRATSPTPRVENNSNSRR